MEIQVKRTLDIIERTPEVVRSMLAGLSDAWLQDPEPGGGWSPRQMVGHWIHGEREDWIERMRIILDDARSEAFVPFDPGRVDEFCGDLSVATLLDQFRELRMGNVRVLRETPIGAADLERTGVHPTFGAVTLGQVLATWATHDLSHIAQLARVLAKRQADAIGPWREFLPIVTR